ncbi:hypothetical protein [Methylobacterium radiotolerans]|jgi:hypothetical protein|nr:hypothetical protein AU375_03995 [Methylobacterium radiotolerans]
MSRTLKRKTYAYETDPDLTKPHFACERDVRVTVEEAIREAARSFAPSEVHTTRFAVAGSVAVLDALRSYRHHGWSYGNGMSDEDDAAED